MSPHQCDKCGRFFNPNKPGVSWAQRFQMFDTWDVYRCASCTEKRGIPQSNCIPPKNGKHQD